MTSLKIARQRLGNQQIRSTSLRTPVEMASWLVALQAQDYSGAKWSLGLRLPSSTDDEVERAIAARGIVRTWPLRGTLHFVSAADVRWLLALLTPRIIAGSRLRHQRLELDDATIQLSQEVFRRALEGGKQLTRDELYGYLETAGISTAGQRGYHMLWRAAQQALICFGPLRAKQQTFVLLDEWLPPTPSLERDQALAALAERYFSSRGPATLQDFAWWSGLTIADARAGIAAAKTQLEAQTIAGRTHWLAHAAIPPIAMKPDVELLPGFDEYLLGYADRSAVLDPADAGAVCPGGNGIFMPTIVVDGRVAGTWARKHVKGRVEVTLKPFAALSGDVIDGLELAAGRYGAFLKLPARVS